MSTALKIAHMSLMRNNVQVLKDISFETQPGFTALIGPNGAGKTTLLRVLSGYLSPSRGEVLLLGKPLQSYSTRHKAQQIAVVTQQANMEYAFSVLDVVLMGRTPWKNGLERDTPQDIDLALEALAQTGMLDFKERLITQLSGGERQRVFVARALCQNTPILLLDEPVSALDLKHQTAILQTVRDAVDAKQLTCVCVLHDLSLAAHYADRVVLMQNGEIAFAGSPRQILGRDIIENVYKTSVKVLEDEGELYILPGFVPTDAP